MKKILMAIVEALTFVIVGCKPVNSVENMETTATAVGKAAGYVANQTKIDDNSRAVVIDIMTKASVIVPTNDQKFVDAWSPIAKEITGKLVADGKINEAQSALINGAFGVACKGLDYLVTVRYPNAKNVENLVSAAVKGFTSGFLTVFKPTNGMLSAHADDTYDKEAYEYLLATELLK